MFIKLKCLFLFGILFSQLHSYNFFSPVIKQERLNGALGKEQWVDVKFMEGPFSVAMKWVKNPPVADRLLFVEDKYNGKMLVRDPVWHGQ